MISAESLSAENATLRRDLAAANQRADYYETQLLRAKTIEFSDDVAALYFATEYSRSFLHRSMCPKDICGMVRRLVLAPMYVNRRSGAAGYSCIVDWEERELRVSEHSAYNDYQAGRAIFTTPSSLYALDARRDVSHVLPTCNRNWHYGQSYSCIVGIEGGTVVASAVLLAPKYQCRTWKTIGQIHDAGHVNIGRGRISAVYGEIVSILTRSRPGRIDMDVFNSSGGIL